MIIIRRLVTLGIALIGVALPVGIAWGGPQWPVDPGVEERPPDLPPWLIASRLGRPLDDASRYDAPGPAGLSDLGAVLLRDAPSEAIEPAPLTLRTSTVDESTDLRALLGEGERWHLMRFGAAAGSRPQEAKATAYGAVAYLPRSILGARPDAGLGFGTAAASALGIDGQEEPISLGFKGELAGLEGGAEYRSVGKRMERVVAGPASQKDTEGTEVWLAQRMGLLRLQLAQSDLSDNVDRTPALPRTSKRQTALSAQFSPRGWPIFGVTYATGDSERLWLAGEGRARPVERQTYDSVAGSAYYAGPGWDVSGTSTYGYSRDPGRPDREMTMLYHDLTLTLRPADSVTVMPSVSTGLDRYEWSATSYQTGSMSLLLTYSPSASRWSLWTLAAYTTSQTSDRTVDGRTMSVSGGLACGLGRILGGRASLSIEAGYDRYVDSVYPDASSRGGFGLVLLKVTSF
jgi:hypothetical protein